MKPGAGEDPVATGACRGSPSVLGCGHSGEAVGRRSAESGGDTVSEQQGSMARDGAGDEAREPAKRSYSRPELTVHGTIEDLTRGVTIATPDITALGSGPFGPPGPPGEE